MNQKALKLKFAFFALLLFLQMPECKAQNEKISWGDPIQMERNWRTNILSDNAGNIYAFSIEKKAVNIKRLQGEKLSFLGEFDIPLEDSEGNSLNYIHRFMFKDAIYIIAEVNQKRAKYRNLKIQKIGSNGQILEPWSDLFQVGAEFKNQEIKCEFIPDLGKLIISGEAFNEVSQEAKGQRFVIFGADLTLEKDFTINQEDSRFRLFVYRWVLNQSGSMFILGYAVPVNENSGLNSRALIIKNDLDGMVQDEWVIPLEKRSILMSSSEIEIDSLGNITLAAFYQDYHDLKREKPANAGVLYMRFASGSSSPIYQKSDDFSKTTLKSIPTAVHWKEEGMEYFNLVHYYRLQSMGSGNFIAVFEQMGKQVPYPYFDIYIFGINKEGNIIWNKTIQRNGWDNNYGTYVQTALHKSDNRVSLFFIDNKNNYDLQGNHIETEKPEMPNTIDDPIMMLSVDLAGNLTFTQIGKLIRGKVRVRFVNCQAIDFTTFFFYSESSGKTYLPGLLKIN